MTRAIREVTHQAHQEKARHGAEAAQTKIIVLVMARSYLVIVETIKRRLETMTQYILFFLAYLAITASIDKAHETA